MKTKETTINFTSKSGKEVIVTVHRKYGAYVEHHHDSENGIDYDTNEFANDHDITVEVPGICKFETKYLPEMKHPKINMYYLSNGRVCVAVPDEIANQIFEAEREQLTDELSPATIASIQEAKAAISEGRVMPKAELSKKRKEYNNLYNEGAEGYNPFDSYLTTEYVEQLKAEYPNQFTTFKKVNENVIIATDQAMVDAGLFKCNPREGQITIWTYEMNHVWNKMQWTPIMRVFTEPLVEDIKDEDGRVIEQKSTHKIDSFYGAPINGNLDLTRFLANRGVNVTPIEA